MRVFLTGASGFVGANMARRLLKEGHEVHLLLREGSNTWRLEDVLGEMNVHRGDICDLGQLTSAVKEAAPQIVIHMGTHGAYPTVQTDFDKIFSTNMIGMANLLKACDAVRYECFINTSSSSEYGLVDKPMSEKDLPMPVNYYGATKAGATVLCQTHTRITDAPIVNVRLFSVYGPYEEKIRLVADTVKKCLLGEPLIFTKATQKRDFIYTTDVENAYLELMKSPQLKGEVLNIGTGTQYSVRHIVERIIERTGTTQKPQWGVIPTWRFEAQNWVADMGKAHSLLKWRAEVSLENGVGKTVDWMKKNMGYYGGGKA